MACPHPEFCRVDRVSKSADEVVMVDLNFSLICCISVEIEFLRIMGMVTLNSASRTSNVLMLDASTCPQGFVWKSWPTSRKPARWRL